MRGEHGNAMVFGAWDLAWTWLRPLEDDTPTALLRFCG